MKMSIVKNLKVKELKAAVKYCMQDHKIISQLVTAYNCTENTIEQDFQFIQQEYNARRNRNKNVAARMIIQSFDSDDNISAADAHSYGIELAEKHLKNRHQYIVITHEETSNLHNHIIFNTTNFEEFKMYDSKRKNTIDDLRKANDEISKRYDLNIPETEKINRNISFNEYVVRAKKRSFKSNLEEIIDKNIQQATNYKEFIQLMEKQDYIAKTGGKYLSFQNPKTGKYLRTKTLGFNYFEESIKYRIEHKNYEPTKIEFIDKKWIDKSQDKFKLNKGLRNWASKQNIMYLSELNNKLYNENTTLKDLQEKEKIESNIVAAINSKMLNMDNKIFELEKMMDCFSNYKDSYELIAALKKADNKNVFKEQHYSEFKAYDLAKKNINYLKKIGIKDESELIYTISAYREERNELYQSLNRQKKQREVNKKQEKYKGI